MAITIKNIISRYPSRDTLVLVDNKLKPIEKVKTSTTVSTVTPGTTTTTFAPNTVVNVSSSVSQNAG